MTVGTMVRAARPGFKLAGRAESSLSGALLGLSIVEELTGLCRCEARFGNWGSRNGATDYLYFDRRTLDFGKAFAVDFEGETLFDGRIMALEAAFPQGEPPTLTVLAEDRFQDLRMTRRTRSWENVTDADVAREIARDHGLTADVDAPSVTHRALAQVNQSDLAFLRERARALGAELWLEDRKLLFKTRGGRRGDRLELSYNLGLREFTALADLAGQRSAVTVTGWSVPDKRAIRHEATDALLRGELEGDESGASILRSALGERKEQLSHTVPLTAQQAQTHAEAIFRLTARRFVTARGTAEAQPKMRAGMSVRLARLGPLFSGKYTVTEVRHIFDGAGIRTEFSAERPGLGRA